MRLSKLKGVGKKNVAPRDHQLPLASIESRKTLSPYSRFLFITQDFFS